MKPLSFGLTGLYLLTVPVLAQDKPIQKDEENIETLVITATPLGQSVIKSASPVSIIAGDELKNKMAPTLGETLKDVPGVHSSYFGPVASSPVIRGLDGPRIKIVQNGLDVADASRVGPDHVVSTETANATQIEVLRGPATLLYGSGAIGGVVNVVDNRLPTIARTQTSMQANYLYNTVSDEQMLSLSADGGNGSWVWHADGFDRHTQDYELPKGALLSEEGEALEHLPNSSIDTHGYTVGGGYVSDSLRVALSYGKLKSDYGIPGHGHEEHDEGEHEGHEEVGHDEHDEEALEVLGRLNQDRYQALLDWLNLDGFIKEVHWHSAYTDYSHAEIEQDVEGTRFFNQSIESRLWTKHKKIQGWQGVAGVTFTGQDFSAFGDEAFTPPSETDSQALYLLEEKEVSDWLWQLGARLERVRISPEVLTAHEHEDGHHDEVELTEQRFTAGSASAGVVWQMQPNQSLAFNYARAERAPSAAELFANGPHIGTNSFELGAFYDITADGEEVEIIGNPRSSEKEVSHNIDLSYRHRSDNTEFVVNLFYNNIDNYVFQQNSGLFSDQLHDEHEDDGLHSEQALPVLLYRQQDAELYGFEVEFDWHLSDSLRIDTYADYTRATLDNGQYVPRIPPLRVAAEMHYETNDWHLELAATHYTSQDNTAPGETSTDSYTLLSFAFNYYLQFDNADMVLFIKGSNLSDTTARVHTSFIKEEAPLPGRAIALGTRVTF